MRERLIRWPQLQGLRIVDASVMPSECNAPGCLKRYALIRAAGITNGNIYAPTMMIAEKSADLILGNTPLPPQRSREQKHNTARTSMKHAPCAIITNISKETEACTWRVKCICAMLLLLKPKQPTSKCEHALALRATAAAAVYLRN